MFSALLSKIWNNCVYFVILLFCRSSWQIAQLLHIINKKNPKEWRRYKLSKTNTRTEEIPFLFNYKLNNIRNLRICTKPFNSCSLSLLTSDMWWVAGTRQQQQSTFSHSSGLMHRPVSAYCALLDHIYRGSERTFNYLWSKCHLKDL